MSKYCPKCGNELPDDAQFCNECGYSVLVDNTHTDEETPKEVMKTEEAETPKKDADEILFNEAPDKTKSNNDMDLKYLATKLHLTFLKTKY